MFFALCSSFLGCQFTKDFLRKLGYSRKKTKQEGGEGEVEDILFNENLWNF